MKVAGGRHNITALSFPLACSRLSEEHGGCRSTGRPGPECRKEADTEDFRYDDAIRNDLCLLFRSVAMHSFCICFPLVNIPCFGLISFSNIEICRDSLNIA